MQMMWFVHPKVVREHAGLFFSGVLDAERSSVNANGRDSWSSSNNASSAQLALRVVSHPRQKENSSASRLSIDRSAEIWLDQLIDLQRFGSIN
jgi:hypothetical protein